MSHFTGEALTKFQEMCAEGLDFGEDPVYNFVQCLTASGDIYGVEPGETCEKGKQISDEQATKLRAKSKRKDSPAARMAKLKKAFIKKMGREMTPEEMAKASRMIDKE